MSIRRRPPVALLVRSCFSYSLIQQTRWGDNDVYGHVNNTVYHAYADTVINSYLIAKGGLDIHGAAGPIGLCVENSFRYHSPVAYPDLIWSGLRVLALGTTSVTYEVGIFRNDDDAAAAVGSFTHVFVDRSTRVKTPIPGSVRRALEVMLVAPPSHL